MWKTVLRRSLLAFTTLATVHCGPGNESTTTGGPGGTGGAGGNCSGGGGTGGAGGAECTSNDKAIRLGKLVNPEDGTVIDKAIVVIHEDRISYVGVDEKQIPCGASVIDWSAYTGLPGLVDSHVHFSYQTDQEPGTLPWSRANWLANNNSYKLLDLARGAARETLKTGVTTAIDKGGRDFILNNLRAEITSARRRGRGCSTPSAGSTITSTRIRSPPRS